MRIVLNFYKSIICYEIITTKIKSTSCFLPKNKQVKQICYTFARLFNIKLLFLWRAF
jgi:hypothetical protein